jgi:hypothetical protein
MQDKFFGNETQTVEFKERVSDKKGIARSLSEYQPQKSQILHA